MREEEIKYPHVNGVCYDCEHCYCLDGKDLRCNKISGIKCKQVRGCISFKHKNLFNDC